MIVHRLNLSLSAALATGVIWIVCALFVMVVPQMAARITSGMLHMEALAVVWQLDVAGVVIGGLAWMLLAFALVWLSTFIYQLMDISDS